MRIHEIKAIQPLTLEKARINALNQAKDRATKVLTAERNRKKKLEHRINWQRLRRILAIASTI